MIDSVLKGTGNSRFLKSAVPAGTSWADALAMLQAGTFPIDFNGINTEGFQQVGTPLNKANMLKDATAAQIGLPPSTTPDGMFQALGNTGELHVWRKTVVTTEEKPAGYTLGDAESGTAISVPNAGSQNYVTLQYGPSITVNDGGGVSLTSVTGIIQFQQISNISDIYDIRNNFVTATPNGGSNSAFDGVIFVPNDCSFKKNGGIVTFGKFYRVNAYPLTPAGTTTTYPVSTNPKAYQEGDDAKAAGYVVGEVETGKFKMSASPTGNTFYVNSAIEVTDDGNITFPEGYHFINIGQNSDGPISARDVLGNFMSLYQNKYDGDFEVGDVWFIPTDATISDYVYVNKRQRVTGYAAIPAGTTIEYLGKLGDKARVQVVSYVGTGTYGEDNPCSITADFKIKVAIYLKSEDWYQSSSKWVEIADDLKTQYQQQHGFVYGQVYNAWGKRSSDSKTITWYNTYSSSAQLNSNGVKYTFLAIG